jgi:hypothetical protein
MTLEQIEQLHEEIKEWMYQLDSLMNEHPDDELQEDVYQTYVDYLKEEILK